MARLVPQDVSKLDQAESWRLLEPPGKSTLFLESSTPRKYKAGTPAGILTLRVKSPLKTIKKKVELSGGKRHVRSSRALGPVKT